MARATPPPARAPRRSLTCIAGTPPADGQSLAAPTAMQTHSVQVPCACDPLSPLYLKE